MAAHAPHEGFNKMANIWTENYAPYSLVATMEDY